MSKDSVIRSVKSNMMVAFGLFSLLPAALHEFWNKPAKAGRYRNNFSAKTKQKLAAMKRRRNLNRMARASRRINRY